MRHKIGMHLEEKITISDELFKLLVFYGRIINYSRA